MREKKNDSENVKEEIKRRLYQIGELERKENGGVRMAKKERSTKWVKGRGEKRRGTRQKVGHKVGAGGGKEKRSERKKKQVIGVEGRCEGMSEGVDGRRRRKNKEQEREEGSTRRALEK